MAGFVLVLTLGSLAAAGLPLLNALVGVALGLMGVQVATGFFDLSSSSSTLALMLGLAVSVDYALFIVTRYRHEVGLGREGEDAAGRAIGTAGSAVVFAGLTVVIALSALSVVGIPFLTAMGLAAAGTVVVAVLIALTLLPAMLGFAGVRVIGGRRERKARKAARRAAKRAERARAAGRPVETVAAAEAAAAVAEARVEPEGTAETPAKVSLGGRWVRTDAAAPAGRRCSAAWRCSASSRSPRSTCASACRGRTPGRSSPPSARRTRRCRAVSAPASTARC